ncbi:MAG: aldehyde ferredoxin oxidoreductase C-terminal domain-containing protein, partial [Chloroflexota bacterium]|nr:aldehyde ferredoxin oxidoreductase C-terminal domain-containing protein [Chloroflexota bacterium]
LYNVRDGLSRDDDQLPRRFTEEPLPLLANVTDESTGKTTLGEEIAVGQLFDFDAMLDRYYKLRGWSNDGYPTHETLDRLSLSREAQEVLG